MVWFTTKFLRVLIYQHKKTGHSYHNKCVLTFIIIYNSLGLNFWDRIPNIRDDISTESYGIRLELHDFLLSSAILYEAPRYFYEASQWFKKTLRYFNGAMRNFTKLCDIILNGLQALTKSFFHDTHVGFFKKKGQKACVPKLTGETALFEKMMQYLGKYQSALSMVRNGIYYIKLQLKTFEKLSDITSAQRDTKNRPFRS